MTRVVNVRTAAPGDVYIGRGKSGVVAPVGTRGCYGNPYGRQLLSLALYQDYLKRRVESDPSFRAAVLALRGQRLACFCAGPDGLEPAWVQEGARCHGQIMARFIDLEAK